MNSYFKFEITQTTKVLLYKMKMGHEHRWLVEGSTEDAEFKLREIRHPENSIIITSCPNLLTITTVNGFEYKISDKEGDGAKVFFHGPVNALLTQSLMPRMTYVPETLIGKTDEMEDFVSIQEFMELREQRHGENSNPQDEHGWRVNMKFNNELFPWLPKFKGQMRDKSQKRKKSGKFNRFNKNRKV